MQIGKASGKNCAKFRRRRKGRSTVNRNNELHRII
jgi:hypothetical protein